MGSGVTDTQWRDEYESDIALTFPRQFFALELDPSAQALYLRITYRCSARQGACFETVANMAKGAGISERSAHRHLKTLLDLGLVRKETSEGKASIYWRTKPEHWKVGGMTDWQGSSEGYDKLAEVETPSLTQKRETPAKFAPEGISTSISTRRKERLFNTLSNVDFTVDTTSRDIGSSLDDDDAGFEDVEVPDPVDELIDTYNSHRSSAQGSLPEVQARRNPKLRRKLEGFIRDARRDKLNPVEVLTTLTKFLARDEFYLSKRYGLMTILINAWKRYDEAVAFGEAAKRSSGGVQVGGRYLFRVSGDDREVVVRSAAPNAPATVVDDDGQMFSVHPGGLRPLQRAPQGA